MPEGRESSGAGSRAQVACGETSSTPEPLIDGEGLPPIIFMAEGVAEDDWLSTLQTVQHPSEVTFSHVDSQTPTAAHPSSVAVPATVQPPVASPATAASSDELARMGSLGGSIGQVSNPPADGSPDRYQSQAQSLANSAEEGRDGGILPSNTRNPNANAKILWFRRESPETTPSGANGTESFQELSSIQSRVISIVDLLNSNTKGGGLHATAANGSDRSPAEPRDFFAELAAQPRADPALRERLACAAQDNEPPAAREDSRDAHRDAPRRVLIPELHESAPQALSPRRVIVQQQEPATRSPWVLQEPREASPRHSPLQHRRFSGSARRLSSGPAAASPLSAGRRGSLAAQRASGSSAVALGIPLPPPPQRQQLLAVPGRSPPATPEASVESEASRGMGELLSPLATLNERLRELTWQSVALQHASGAAEEAADMAAGSLSDSDLEWETRTFCLDTGGGVGTWLRVFNGHCFGLGVETVLPEEQEDSDSEEEGWSAAWSASFRFDKEFKHRNETMRVRLPAGFAEGRDMKPVAVRRKTVSAFSEICRAPTPRSVAFGRVCWDRVDEPVKFVRCSTTESEALLPHLLRFFVQHVWGLTRPRVLISLVGGGEMELRADRRRKLGGIMDVAAETRAWILTNGLDSGISKLLAERRKEDDHQVPLVGFAAWGMVEGRQVLWEDEGDGRLMHHNEKLPVEDFSTHERQFSSAKPLGSKSCRLSKNHSHVVLVDDSSVGQGGGESRLRAGFETAMCSPDVELQDRIRQTLLRENLGWQLMTLMDEDVWVGRKQRGQGAVPVGVCVGGEEATLGRVYEMVKRGTPVLICRGTGKATDLLADAIWMHESLGVGGDYGMRGSGDEESGSRFGSVKSGEEFWAEAVDEGAGAGLWESEERQRITSELLARGHGSANGVSDHWIMEEASRVYGIANGFRDFEGTVAKIVRITESGLCNIFDLNRQEDLSGAMLNTILKAQRQMGVEWHDCLQLNVIWNHVGIMKNTLDRIRKVTVGTRRALEAAFHSAFVDNKAAMAWCLLQHMNCANTYNIKGDTSASVWTTAMMKVNTKRAPQDRLTLRWSNLVSKAMKELNEEFAGGAALQRWSELHERSMQDEEARKLLDKMPRSSALVSLVPGMSGERKSRSSSLAIPAAFTSISSPTHFMSTTSQALGGSGSLGNGANLFQSVRRVSTSMFATVGMDMSEGGARRGSPRGGEREKVHDLEAVYVSLIGEDFSLETSTMGAELDLFFWSLLMRRKTMAKMLWERLDTPIRAMLMAASLCRHWAKMSDVKVHVREGLLEDANEYEQVAIGVQTSLMRIDAHGALQALELPSRLFKGMTGVDIAIQGGCEQFIERCCGEALDCRWTGDIHPSDQRFGLYPSVLLCLLSFGLLAPDLIVFRPPPRAEALRTPAQRRAIPTGYKEGQGTRTPYLDHRGDVAQRTLSLKLQRLNQAGRSTVHLPTDMGQQTSSLQTQMRWTERMWLFAEAPVTIFMVDSLQELVFNFMFTNLLVSGSDAPAGSVSWTELVLCWAVLSTTVFEGVQFFLDGFRRYLSNSWNWFSLMSCGFFWLGLASKLSGFQDGLLAGQLYYSASVFFMWMKVLHLFSVHRALGPLVIAFGRMRDDVFLFGTIWMVLLLAFGTAMQGTGPLSTGEIRPHQDDANPMFGWRSWWLVRTWFQSLGEPFFEELKTDASNIVMLVMFPVMNLMLVNLLIAIMNDTYTDVKGRSRLQWMLQMYDVSKEYRSTARINLATLLWDVFQFYRRKGEVDRRCATLRSRTKHSWLQDLRFKYKRFQTRDLPPLDKKEQRLELTKRVQALEAKELGSSNRHVGIPGRVYMKQQVEWHRDVTSLGSHQYLRKELAIRCGLRGCVAVPFQLEGGNRVEEEEGQEDGGGGSGCVLVLYSTGRMSAHKVDRVLRAVQAATAGSVGGEDGGEGKRELAGEQGASRGAGAHGLPRPPSDVAARTSGIQRLASGGESFQRVPSLGMRRTGKSFLLRHGTHGSLVRDDDMMCHGEEPAATVLERVSTECSLAYAEAMRPGPGGAMLVVAHFCRGSRAEAFFQETMTRFHFPMHPPGSAKTPRADGNGREDDVSVGRSTRKGEGEDDEQGNAGEKTQGSPVSIVGSIGGGGGARGSMLSRPSPSGSDSSSDSSDEHAHDDLAEDGEYGRAAWVLRPWRWMMQLLERQLGRHPQHHHHRGHERSLEARKAKLKHALLKLRVEEKQDEEALRAVHNLVLHSKSEYLRSKGADVSPDGAAA